MIILCRLFRVVSPRKTVKTGKNEVVIFSLDRIPLLVVLDLFFLNV